MSELNISPSDAAPDMAPGAGTMLRSAREAAGMHVAALAVALKVPVRRLEALEAERWDELPDAVFIRALAGSVCRVLKIDPAPVLSRLPAAPAATMTVETGLNEPFRRVGGANLGLAGGWQPGSRLLMLAVAVLVAGALGLMLWPTVERVLAQWMPLREEGTVVSAAAPLTQEKQGEIRETPNGVGLVASLPATGAALESAGRFVTSPQAVPASGVAEPVGTQAAVAVPVVPGNALAASAAQTPQPADLLVFKTSAESWVEVTDSRGAVVFRKLLATGESAHVSGNPPLSVLVGRADVTSVEVRGQAIDLMAQARNNIARFEVK